MSKTPWKTALALYLVAQALFLVRLRFRALPNFDEYFYVPAARTFLQFDHIANFQHPPLAKMLIAIGIALIGDQPIGWRAMSTVFGALTLVGMFFWANALFREKQLALFVALVTLANQMLFVESRIAMLDVFLGAFLVWAFACFTAAWRIDLLETQVRSRLLAAGCLFGLAIACKWVGVLGLATCIGMAAVVHLLKLRHFAFEERAANSTSNKSDWYSPRLFNGINLRDWILYLGLIPALAYSVTFIPYFFFKHGLGAWRFFSIQIDMLRFHRHLLATAHLAGSPWYDWPLMKSPMWYVFEKQDSGLFRGVFLVGNPLVMLCGALSLLICLVGFLRFRSREGFLVICFYLGLFLTWSAFSWRDTYFYYYHPASLVLSLALGYAFSSLETLKRFELGRLKWGFLAAAMAIFAYFFPVLSAQELPKSAFEKRLWFSSWRLPPSSADGWTGNGVYFPHPASASDGE